MGEITYRSTHTHTHTQIRNARARTHAASEVGDKMSLEVRVCEAKHLARVRKDTNWEQSGHFFDVPFVETALDTSILSIIAIESETDRIVGFLALEVTLSTGDVQGNQAVSEWIESEMVTLGFHPGNNLWVNACSLAKKDGEAALRSMLKFAFSKFAHVQTIAYPVVDRSYTPHKALPVLIPKISQSTELKVSLSCVERSVICPKLVVRPAKVEDHDDLVPVVEEMRSKFADLSELPDSVKPGEKFALARLIENDSWSVLVATVDESIVGMMCLQEIEELEYYQENFDLEMFDDLASVSGIPEQAQEVEEVPSDGKGEETEEEPAEAAEGETAEETEAGEKGESAEEEEKENSAESNGSEEDQQEQEEENEEEDFDFTDDEEEGEEENAKEEDLGEAAPEVKRESMAFAVKMFCMKDEYADHAMDFLQPAFDSFPSKDYCIVTLSHTSRVPSLLLPFSQATPATQKVSSDVLYVLHRYSLLMDFEAKKATIKDYNEIIELLGELAEEKHILEAINTAIDQGNLMKAVCQDQIVGVCSVEPKVELNELMANFQLNAFSETLSYRYYNIGEVTTFVMNPVFAYQKRFFLSSIMRHCSKTSLCFFLEDDKPVADILDVFEPVSERKAKGVKDSSVNYALFTLNQRDVYKEKEPINSRVIVVGASSCGLACLESFLQSKEYQFTNLTLVTSDQTEGYDVSKLTTQHAFLSQVLLISSSVVEIDREAKQIYLQDETILSYDILVLTSGIQDQINFSIDDEEPLPVVSAASLKEYLKAEESKPKHAIVYGGQGEAFNAMSTLEEEGIDYTYAAPETFSSSKLIEQIATEMNIDMYLRKPSRMALHGVFKGVNSPLSCSFVNTDGSIIKTETSLLVLAHEKNVNPHIFGCLNDSSIVYDGRLVVDGNFNTTDEFIFGGGTLAKFSRLYGGSSVEAFNSTEVGRMLAANITRKCERAANVGSAGADVAVPVFREPVGFSFKLPYGPNLYVTMISAPPLDTSSLAAPPGGRLLRTVHEGQLSILGIDKRGVVAMLCFCGPTHASVEKMKGLMGLHVNYLGNIAGEVCLLSYLLKPERDALYSELVLDLRRTLLKNYSFKTQTRLRETIVHGVLEAVKENIQLFPRYHLPYSDTY